LGNNFIIGGGPIGLTVAFVLCRAKKNICWIRPHEDPSRTTIELKSASQHCDLENSIFSGKNGNLYNWGGRVAHINEMNFVKEPIVNFATIQRGQQFLKEFLSIDFPPIGEEYWINDPTYKIMRRYVEQSDNFCELPGWVKSVVPHTDNSRLIKLENTNGIRNLKVKSDDNIFICAGALGNAAILKRHLLETNSTDSMNLRYEGHVSGNIDCKVIDNHLFKKSMKRKNFKNTLSLKKVLQDKVDGFTLYWTLKTHLDDKSFMLLLARKLVRTPLGRWFIKLPIIRENLENKTKISWYNVLETLRLKDLTLVFDIFVQKFIFKRRLVIVSPIGDVEESLCLHFQLGEGLGSKGEILLRFDRPLKVALMNPELKSQIKETIYRKFKVSLGTLGVNMPDEDVFNSELDMAVKASVDGYHQFSTMYKESGEPIVGSDLCVDGLPNTFVLTTGLLRSSTIDFPTFPLQCFAAGFILDLSPRNTD